MIGRRLRDVIFLPVAERELRVAARKRSTARARVIGALAALAITLLFLGTFSLRMLAASSASHGQMVYNILLWLTFAAALLSGLFLTADTISEEKREGTLGLLFLTDLTGFDVIVGKLLASSLVGFYALLAVFPIMAVPLLMGGVTGIQFWKSVVALVSTMLLSLSCGLFVSTLTRSSHRAMMITFGLLASLTIGGPLCDQLMSLGTSSAKLPFFSLTSPAFLLTQSDAWALDNYVYALAVNQLLAALLFVGAIVLAPTRWQDRATDETARAKSRPEADSPSPAPRSNLGSDDRSRDPIRWLHSRHSGSRRMAWAWTWLMIAGTGALIFNASGNALQGWSLMSGVFVVPLYLLASMSGRFLLEGRRSGSLELLLTTPVSPREIIQGHWRGCRRQFGLAFILLVLAQTTLSVASTRQMWLTYSVAPSPPPSTLVLRGNPAHLYPWPQVAGAVGIGLVSGAATLLNLAALFWFGLWAGLTSGKPALASLKTLAFVQFIPWLVINFCTFVVGPMLLFGLLRSGANSWFPHWYFGLTTSSAALLSIGKDLFYIGWARRRLFDELPRRATLTGLVR